MADLRKIVKEAQERRKLSGRRTILFIDEIHRFNKAQQDAILPYVEDGTITLIGATTENPSFEVNSALLSRARVVQLYPADRRRPGHAAGPRPGRRGARPGRRSRCTLTPEARAHLLALSSGDARVLLNTLELAGGRPRAGRRRRARCSTWPRWKTPCSAAPCNTTRAASSTTT